MPGVFLMTDHGFWAKIPFHYITGRAVAIIMNDHCCVGREDLVEAVLGRPLPCSSLIFTLLPIFPTSLLGGKPPGAAHTQGERRREYRHNSLGFFSIGPLVLLPGVGIYSVTYLDQYGLTGIYFMLWSIILYHFILMLKVFWLWPSEAL